MCILKSDVLHSTYYRIKNDFMIALNGIQWEEIIISTLHKLITLVLLLLVYFALKKGGLYFIKNTISDQNIAKRHHKGRMKTMHSLVSNIYRYLLGFFLIYGVLSTFNVPVNSILAGAGIAGAAIGLGSQSLIKDVITGLFILIEKQINVGDYIRLQDEIEGTVISIGIRNMQIRSDNGTAIFIPNGSIDIVKNLSLYDRRVTIDVRILPNSDIHRIEQIMEGVNELFQNQDDRISKKPRVLGVMDNGVGNLFIRSVVYTDVFDQKQIRRDFLGAYIDAIYSEGIELPSFTFSDLHADN